MLKITTVILFAALTTGCAGIPMGSPDDDARLKEFAVPQKNAGLYIFRNEIQGNILAMDVELDGKNVGRTIWRTYLYKEVTPGIHVVTSRASNVHSIEIDLEPGTLNYVWQEVMYGFPTARTKLHIVGEQEGQKGVLESKLAETM